MTAVMRVLSPGSFPGGVEPLEQGCQGEWGQALAMLDRELGAARLDG